MQRLLLGPLILLSFSFFHAQELSFYKTTEHFTLFCLPQERDIADKVLQESEKILSFVCGELNHTHPSQLTIYMYSNLNALRESIQYSTYKERPSSELFITNPYDKEFHQFNPIITQTINTHLAELLIAEKYTSTNTPVFLQQGLALYLIDKFSHTSSFEKYKDTLNTLPTLKELEENIIHDQSIDGLIAEFIAPYLFVEFIDTQWNRETLLNLLNNYVDFENILNFLKKDVEKHWHYSVLFKTYGFKSSDPSISLIMDDLFNTFEQALSIPQKHQLSLSSEEINQAFDVYKKMMKESDNYLLIVIKTNKAIAGWALFSLQSPQHAILEAMCIHPDYKKQDISKKLITDVHKKFHTIKSIVTVNENINTKSSCFCGIINFN